jgi:putative tryptophan/tyrosine transport system substrate-binding protein
MRRRDFITLLGGAAAAWPPAARAAVQSRGSGRRAASVCGEDPIAYAWNQAFLRGLGSLGWAKGDNVEIDFRWAGADFGRLPYLAKELLDRQPDVVLAVTTPAVNALLQITRSIPVVFTQVTDPVAQGLVASLARPGGNITGFAILEPEIAGKWVQVLKEIAPEMTRVAVIFNPDTASPVGQQATLRLAKVALALKRAPTVTDGCQRSVIAGRISPASSSG